MERLNELGIETVITTCPECYMTLHTTYAELGFAPRFKVVHLYDFLEEQIDKGAVGFAPLDRKITFQDSCRLGRLEHRTDLPRQLLARLKPVRFTEMQASGGAQRPGSAAIRWPQGLSSGRRRSRTACGSMHCASVSSTTMQS